MSVFSKERQEFFPLNIFRPQVVEFIDEGLQTWWGSCTGLSGKSSICAGLKTRILVIRYIVVHQEHEDENVVISKVLDLKTHGIITERIHHSISNKKITEKTCQDTRRCVRQLLVKQLIFPEKNSSHEGPVQVSDKYFLCLVLFSKTKFYYADQSDITLIFLPLIPQFWGYRCVLSYLLCCSFYICRYLRQCLAPSKLARYYTEIRPSPDLSKS